MSTNWLHDLLFGSNESTIKALEKLQQMDAEQFQKAFSALEKLQKGQQINADQLQIAFSRLEELQAAQKIDAGRFESIQKYLDGLQERLADVGRKSGNTHRNSSRSRKNTTNLCHSQCCCRNSDNFFCCILHLSGS